VANAPASLSPTITITPGPTIASSVFSLAGSDRRALVSSAEMEPKAPLMSATREVSVAATRPCATKLGLVVMAEHPFHRPRAGGIGGHAGFCRQMRIAVLAAAVRSGY
jgi:hypothetical protein